MSSKAKNLEISIHAAELNPAQIRLIKSINIVLTNVLTTGDEAEYFKSSSELMRMCASLIKQGNFSENNSMKGIPYADQALEFSVENICEHITNQKIISFDN